MGLDGGLADNGGLSAGVLTSPSAGEYSAVTHGKIPANSVYAGSGAAINTWLAALPHGARAVFPPVAGSAQGITEYSFDRTIIVPDGVEIQCGYTPAAPGGLETVIFSVDTVNWTGAAVGMSNGTMVSNVQAGNGVTNYNPRIKNVGINCNAKVNFTAFALIHPTEQTDCDGLICYPAVHGGSPSGLCALLIISNGDNPPNGTGFTRIRNVHGYAYGYSNFISIDASNNGQLVGTARFPIAGFIIEYTSPSGTRGANGTACTDSPIKIIVGDNIILKGFQNCMPPVGQDTAGIRCIDCGQIVVEDLWYESDSAVQTRPLIKSTLSGGAISSKVAPSPPTLQNVRMYNAGWQARADASCGLTAASTTITDASITAADQYCPVYGPGIPSGAYVATVNVGVSFTVQDAGHAPFITGTVTLNIGANVIEDEVTTSRHFQWHATYFDPKLIYRYTGSQCDWLNGPNSAPVRRFAEAKSRNTEFLYIAPNGAITETFQRKYTAGNSDTVSNAGTPFLGGVVLYPGDLVSNIVWVSSSTPLSVGTHQWSALIGPGMEQLAISSDLTSTAWAASSAQTFAMGTAYSVSLPALHYLAVCVVATTAPTLATGTNPAVLSIVGANGLRLAGASSSTGLSTPATCPATMGNPTGTANGVPYAYLT